MAIEISAEHQANLKTLVVESVDNWNSKATQEQKAAGEALMQRFKDEPEFGATYVARMKTNFEASDANQDGQLDRQEYMVFQEKQCDHARQDGTFVEPTPNYIERCYELFQQIAGGEGITFEQYLAITGKFMAIFKEMNDAAESA